GFYNAEICEGINLIKTNDPNGKTILYDKCGNELFPSGSYKSMFYVIGKEKGSGLFFICTRETGEKDIYNNELELVMSLPEGISVRDIQNGMILYNVLIPTGDSEKPYIWTGSYGYLNMNGEILATGQYSSSEDYYTDIIEDYRFSEDFAILNIGDRYGYINNKGKVVIPLKYTAVTPFIDGVCFARSKEGKWEKILINNL
ncbi:MAG: WG repeat-containing protein, partial [Muribaculaceae bacterium]|nr:WG repeat-containing protein [Muribaculaceae bacterium]